MNDLLHTAELQASKDALEASNRALAAVNVMREQETAEAKRLSSYWEAKYNERCDFIEAMQEQMTKLKERIAVLETPPAPKEKRVKWRDIVRPRLEKAAVNTVVLIPCADTKTGYAVQSAASNYLKAHRKDVRCIPRWLADTMEVSCRLVPVDA